MIRRLYRWLRGQHEQRAMRAAVGVETHVYVVDDGRVREVPVSHNTTKNAYLTHLIDQLDPNTTVSEIDASHFAVGTDSSDSVSGFLGSKVGSNRTVDTFTDNGDNAVIVGTLSKTQANGNSLSETGLIDDTDSTAINRATFQSIDKTEDIEVKITFEYEITPA